MIIGERLRIEYFDQNEDFAEILPRSGTVIKRFETENVENWYLLALDDPIEYVRVRHELILIRSRWKDNEVGGLEPTSVFIVLIPDPSLLEKDPIDIDKCELVAWGMSYTE